MTDDKRGCFGSLLGPLLALGAPRRALPGPALPALVGTRYDPADRPAVARAHRAAERCLAAAAAEGAELSPEVVAAVQNEVVVLIEQIHRLGAETTGCRRWLADHSADAIARRRTELELKSLDADVAERRSVDDAMRSLDAQRAAVTDVEAQVARMSAALVAAGQQVEAVEARLQQLTLKGGGDGAAVIEAVRRQHGELAETVDAFAATVRELR